MHIIGAALERSGMLDALLKRASDKIGSFCASDVTFALDGMARMRLQPETPVLDALAQKVHFPPTTPHFDPHIWANFLPTLCCFKVMQYLLRKGHF